MVKHCYYGFCTSNSRHANREDMKNVFFVSFPKQHIDGLDKCVRWILACGREDVTLEKVQRDTYVCSKHFVGGQGPTDQYPDPVAVTEEDFVAQQSPSTRRSKKLVCRPVDLATKLFGVKGEQVLKGEVTWQSLGTNHLFGQAEAHYQNHGDTGDEDQQISQDGDLSFQIKMEPQEYQEDQMPSTLSSCQGASTSTDAQNLPSSSGINNSSLSSMDLSHGFVTTNPSHTNTRTRKRRHEPEQQNQEMHDQMRKGKKMVPASNSNSASTGSFLNINVSELFSPRKLSQTPTALRTRKSRQTQKVHVEQYEEHKERDAERQREYRKNMSEKQREQSRESSRERTRRYRLRKKLLSLGVASNALPIRKRGKPKVPTVRDLQLLMNMSNEPQSTLAPSTSRPSNTNYGFGSNSLKTSQNAFPKMDEELQCNMTDGIETKSSTRSIAGIGGSKFNSVPTDIFMWAGPDMVDSETNTELLSRPGMVEKGCQMQINRNLDRNLNQRMSEASCQTDLTMHDMGAYDAEDRGRCGSQERRKFIMADVMRDDQSCNFYTGFSLLKIVWLFDLLKGSIPNYKSNGGGVQKENESASHLNRLEQFLLVMVWLRQGLSFEFLAHMFGVTYETVHEVCTLWMTTMIKNLPLLNATCSTQSETSGTDVKDEQQAGSLLVGIGGATKMADTSSHETNKVHKTRSTSKPLTLDIAFQRKKNISFMISDSSPCNYMISSYTAHCSDDSVNMRYPVQFLPSVKCLNKTNGKVFGRKGDVLKRFTSLPPKSKGTTKSKRLYKKTSTHDARQQHIHKEQLMKELVKFNLLNTVHPLSHKLLMKKALSVCVALGNVSVTDVR